MDYRGGAFKWQRAARVVVCLEGCKPVYAGLAYRLHVSFVCDVQQCCSCSCHLWCYMYISVMPLPLPQLMQRIPELFDRRKHLPAASVQSICVYNIKDRPKTKCFCRQLRLQ